MFNPAFLALLTVDEAAAYAGVDRSTITRALKKRRMQGARLGSRGQWVTTKEAIDEHFRDGTPGWLAVQKRYERAAKVRAGFQCQKCKVTQPHYDLQVYYVDRDDTNFGPTNLIVLCYLCYKFAMRIYHPDQMLLPGLDLPHWLKGG